MSELKPKYIEDTERYYDEATGKDYIPSTLRIHLVLRNPEVRTHLSLYRSLVFKDDNLKNFNELEDVVHREVTGQVDLDPPDQTILYHCDDEYYDWMAEAYPRGGIEVHISAAEPEASDLNYWQWGDIGSNAMYLHSKLCLLLRVSNKLFSALADAIEKSRCPKVHVSVAVEAFTDGQINFLNVTRYGCAAKVLNVTVMEDEDQLNDATPVAAYPNKDWLKWAALGAAMLVCISLLS